MTKKTKSNIIIIVLLLFGAAAEEVKSHEQCNVILTEYTLYLNFVDEGNERVLSMVDSLNEEQQLNLLNERIEVMKEMNAKSITLIACLIVHIEKHH